MHFFRTVSRAQRAIPIIFSLINLVIPVSMAQLVVEQPVGSPVAVEGARDFGFSFSGSSNSLVFTLRNTGSVIQTGISASIEGASAGDFTIVSNVPAILMGNTTTNFIVVFSSTADGPRSARLSIHADSLQPGSYGINLTGQGVVPQNDTDLDGLSDAAEIELAALGFNWQIAQKELVKAYYENASAAGLYTASQVADLNLETPVIQPKADGRFVLTLGLKQSTDLKTFSRFPFTSSGISVNGEGEIEFIFPSAEKAAFFRVKAE